MSSIVDRLHLNGCIYVCVISMRTCTITVNEAGGKPVEFVLVTDLSPSIIQEVMKKPLNILKVDGNVARATALWHAGIATRIIKEPRKYRDSRDEVMHLPWKSALELFNKINEIYPFQKHVPPEYSESVRELGEKWTKAWADLVENWSDLMSEVDKLQRHG